MKKFTLIWIGEFISAIGSGLTSFGLGIYVYELTGSSSMLGLVTLCAFLPSLLLSIPSGVLADRYDRRLLMLIGDSFSALGILLILICIQFQKANVLIICIGVAISSIFSSLMEPSYKATVSDLLSKDQYAKASGMVQIASSSKYLISPLLAGLLLTWCDVRLLLVLDISTFFVTVLTVSIARKGIKKKEIDTNKSMIEEFKDGFLYLKKKRGIWILIIVTSIITFFMGIIQVLSTPMILSFSNQTTLGVLESVIACGMLFSSILIGVLPIKKNYFKMLVWGLILNGFAMVFYGLRENMILIGISGFIFFATLPLANTGIECLVRQNVLDSMQGRVWGIIGIISQIGYVISYALCGLLADYVFIPLLLPKGPLASSLGKVFGVGEGRGIGFLISISGIGMMVLTLVLSRIKVVVQLEDLKENQ